MSATTDTRNYQLMSIAYNTNSEELTSIHLSTTGAMELGFELTPEMQPTALMVFASVHPKKYEAFMTLRDGTAGKSTSTLPPKLIRSSDAWKVFSARDLETLRRKGIIGEDE